MESIVADIILQSEHLSNIFTVTPNLLKHDTFTPKWISGIDFYLFFFDRLLPYEVLSEPRRGMDPFIYLLIF